MSGRIGPLAGVRVLEIAGIGPAPFCGMLLADLGADVVVVDRVTPNAENVDLGTADVLSRGKRSISLDLKSPPDVERVLRLVERSDALIEGMRPGVMERLGLGPEMCRSRNPRLVYGRMTGWGQTGPLSKAAGHDLNYLALSGALWYAGEPGDAPFTPPSLLGDIGAGALYLAVGLLAALMSARQTGEGQVVDAAIVDGAAHMMSLLMGLRAGGQFVNERGRSLLDGPPWYATYRCADGGFVTLGAVEPKFYREFRARLGLLDDPAFERVEDPEAWPVMKQRFAALFASRTRAEWSARLEGSDVCFAAVLDPSEASRHPHLAARGIYLEERGILQAAPAPRFSATPELRPGEIRARGADAAEVARDWLGEG